MKLKICILIALAGLLSVSFAQSALAVCANCSNDTHTYSPSIVPVITLIPHGTGYNECSTVYGYNGEIKVTASVTCTATKKYNVTGSGVWNSLVRIFNLGSGYETAQTTTETRTADATCKGACQWAKITLTVNDCKQTVTGTCICSCGCSASGTAVCTEAYGSRPDDIKTTGGAVTPCGE